METAHDNANASGLRFRSGVHVNAARQHRPEGNPTPSSQRELRFRQVYPANDDPVEAEYYPDIDIIAIHGLDTNSSDTWKWRAPSNHKTGPETDVNWLSDPDMLPKHIGRAQIFTCDWPADLLQQSSVPTTLDECAQSLRNSIEQHVKAGARRPIFFIASCLGGIILMKALEIDNQHAKDDTTSPSLTSATRGIVFLATPFRGTAFNNILGFLLKALNSLQDQAVSSLIDYAQGATPELDELARRFITLTKRHEYNVFMFWEAQNTVLLPFASTWLLGSFSPWLLVAFFLWLPAFFSCQPQLLVNKHSATLSDFDSQRLDRTHVMMNKFAHSKCIKCNASCMESKDFGLVSDKIVKMLHGIRMGSPLQEADDWIRNKHYTTDRLRIERLSGEALSMDQCYINLAIVEVPRKKAQYTAKELDAARHPFPFSYTACHPFPFVFTARRKVKMPNKNIQIELPSLFDLRKDSNGQKMQPRRVLIRGHAGVGKTTLCKKMVHEFQTPEFRNWNKLFDRVFWLPLRRLKEWSGPPDNLEKLFLKIYFNQKTEKNGAGLAQALCDVVERGRTLFIFDGLDEIAGHWDSEHGMSEFLKDLLNQPNVIITSRPHVSLPANVQAPDVELETIGFYPSQVKDYIQAAFTDTVTGCTDTKKIEEIQSYLQARRPIRDLVRIPIQLDALCFTWDKDFSTDNLPESMTELYEAIALKLWQKDIHRLYAKSQAECRKMNINRVKEIMGKHMNLLGALAFSGLYNNVLDFDSNYRTKIYDHFGLSVTEFLIESLSFLRTSDSSVGKNNQYYHFLHLTFQEYFAARYFVQQWKGNQPLRCMELNKRECVEIKTATFLHENKYKPRYDIFWRFVAGLLSVDGKALSFFKAVEEKPRDLLGPTHQYLIMHCLSEVEQKDTTFAKFRIELEDTLRGWLLFECRLKEECYLASEMECPEQVLTVALEQASEYERQILLRSLQRRTAIPSSVLHLIVPWLENSASTELKIAILDIMKHHHQKLPGNMLHRIETLLDDEGFYVRLAAARALQGQANLTENLLQRIAALLKDGEQADRVAMVKVVQFQASLHFNVRRRIAALLEDEDKDMPKAILRVMSGQANLTEDLLEHIAALLENNGETRVQDAVLRMLHSQDNLTHDMLQCVKRLLNNKHWFIRQAALEVFQDRASLTDSLLQCIAALVKDENYVVREAAVEVLLCQRALLLNSLGKDKSSFFQILLKKSFEQHLYCSGESFIGVGSRHVPLICKRENQIGDEILNLQRDLDVPLPYPRDTSCS